MIKRKRRHGCRGRAYRPKKAPPHGSARPVWGGMTVKRFWCLCLAVLACCALLCGCSSGDAVFYTVVSGTVNTLDPQLAQTDAEKTVAVNLFEGLFRLGPDGGVQPAACEKYTVSADGLVWTFTLREGLHYNDGSGESPATPVTAADYAFALQRLFDANVSSPYRGLFSGLAGAEAVLAGEADVQSLGVSAVDDRTLILRLRTPDDGLPRKLCSAGAMPCNRAFYEAAEGAYGLDTDTTLANGKFRISLWSDENGVTLRRLEAAEGMVNKVRLLPRGESDDPAARLAAGELSGAFVSGMPPQAEAETFCVQTQVLLFHCTDPQLADANIRAGLAGVLYTALPEVTAEGVSTAGGLIPDSLTFGGGSWRQRVGSLLNEALPQDAAAAFREGLTAAGLSKLSGVTVLVPDTPEGHALYESVSLAWQQQLSAFFSVQYLPEEEIEAAVADGSYQLAFVTRRARQEDAAAELAAYTAAGDENLTDFSSAELDALLQAARTAATTQEAAQQLRAAELLLLSQWAAAPISTQTEYYALAPGFAGVAASPFGPVLDFTQAVWSE